MYGYDVKKIRKTARKFKSNYFRSNNKEKEKTFRSIIKNSRKKRRGHNTSSRLARQLESENKTHSNESYLAVERRLDVDQNKWGVDAVSNKILQLVKHNYKFKLINSNNPVPQRILQEVYTKGKKAVKSGYEEALETLIPIPPEIKKLIAATFKQSSQKLTNWFQEEKENPSSITKKNLSKQELINLEEKIPELIIKQGIYLKEGKTHLPAINLKA